MNSRELRAERASLFTRMQELVDRAEGENRNLSAEETAEYNRLHDEQNTLLDRITRQEELETTRQEPVANTLVTPPERYDGSARADTTSNDDHTRYVSAFNAYMRRRPGTTLSVQDSEALASYYNVLQTDTGAAGGYTIPPEFTAGVERAMLWYGGMREAATVFRTDSGADLPFATNDDTGNTGEIVTEGATISTQDTSFGVRIMKAYMYSSKVIRVSYQLLNDTGFDLMGHISTIAGERIARVTNTHFTTGTGANMPSGIVGDATTGKTTAATQAITFDELMALEHSVDKAYRNNGRFMFHDTTLLHLKTLKDGNGNYIWLPSTRDGEPDRINQYAYTINNDMVPVLTASSGDCTVLFGDLTRYKIRDITGLSLVRLDELYAAQLQVGFFVFSRHDGALIDAGQHPVKKLVQL